MNFTSESVLLADVQFLQHLSQRCRHLRLGGLGPPVDHLLPMGAFGDVGFIRRHLGAQRLLRLLVAVAPSGAALRRRESEVTSACIKLTMLCPFSGEL
ncbi:hypothetical protein EYF80_019635 [Liparis tanakae]|uniref:Uncharacterized protein n=1 Tax=Liparis tanakae TaxID=230148 RepID=A0A4Z2HXS3_9TELE|nr:hypothetical protein EYF80_019635 [Liparis tanakae]